MAKISVIVPIYNVEKYLRECLDSIINQTLKDIEIICINDGSTDNSDKILEEYSQQDNRIIILKRENRGVSTSRNEAIKISNGEFVCFIDADDIYPEDDILATLYTKAKENNVLIAGGEFAVFDSNTEPYEYKQKFGKSAAGYLFKKSGIINYKDYQFDYGFHRFIYNKEFLLRNNILYPNYVRYEDPVFFVRAMNSAGEFYALDKICYGYRTGHKVAFYDEQSIKDTLCAVLDNLDYASKNKLSALENYTAKHFLELYKIFSNSITSDMSDLVKKIFSYKSVSKLYFRHQIKGNLQKIFSLKNAPSGQHKIITFMGVKLKLKRKYKFSYNECISYIDYVQNQQLDKSQFVSITDNNCVLHNSKPKLISFYLPQFHDFPENIKWFGRGFSEWSNVTKAVPQYIGHYQPHLPIDVGFYNLETTDIMKRQIELAKMYGIYGFSFYYYWFSGQKVMEKPIETFLQDKSLDMPFFIFWANEDWTMLWDNGKDKEILHKQELQEGDAAKFMRDVLPYMQDERYIKIGNKPLFVIYNPHNYPFDKYIKFNNEIRVIAKESGFDDLYIMTTTYRADCSVGLSYSEFLQKYKFDALFEFYPQGIEKRNILYKAVKFMNPKFRGRNFDIEEFIQNKKYMYLCDVPLYKGCFPTWDNTSRKCYTGADIYQNNPENYKRWLKDLILWTNQHHQNIEEQFVFINAWNEWAEGAHLEPDQKYGYAYLQATKEVLEECDG